MQYHDGFESQVAQWPANPLDVLVAELQTYPRGTVIGDFGCGRAALAAALPQHRVHSFDLVAANSRVTACDMAHVCSSSKHRPILGQRETDTETHKSERLKGDIEYSV
jgi:hypothetical protein